MKYFLTEAERKKRGSTLYFEFQKGKFKGKCWLNDSLCLHADIFDRLKLYGFFSKVMPTFDYYYMSNYVTRDTWALIRSLSKEHGGEIEELIKELTPWANDCFEKYDVFTICGI